MKKYLYVRSSLVFCLFFLLSLCLIHPFANAQIQVYPVSVTTQLSPPYSVNLADYAVPGCEQLKVIIVQRDLTQAPYLMYLKMEIEHNGKIIIRSSPQYIPPALTLEPGIPTVFSGTELSLFFEPRNMDFTGYSREEYMRTKLLPEGAYVISFTAYDWTRRDIALSRGGSFFCYLAKTDPPVLNLPLNNSLVKSSSPQNINFQWLSRSTSSPNSAWSTRYRFELFEMRTGGIYPSELVQVSNPIFTSETDRSSLLYSILEPPLEKGMRYVWRVKAFDVNGRDFIRNNGYSEVFSFVYGDSENGPISFEEIENFNARAISSRIAELTWNSSSGYDRYKIFYRKKGDNNRWYESETINDKAEIKGLSPGVIYECRVQGKSTNAWGSFSQTDTVLLPLPEKIDCGSPFQPLVINNREPLLELMKMQEFDAGGFMVTIIDPYAATTRPGRFSGRGFVQVPLFGHKKIRCEFADIFVNTDFQMTEGSVRLICDKSEDGDNLIWDIDDVFEGGEGNGKVEEGIEEVAVYVPDIVIKEPSSIILDTIEKEIIIVSDLKDTIHIDVSEKLMENQKTLTLKDSEGYLYSVDTQTGKATSLGKTSPAGSQQQIATLPEVIDSRKGMVIFEPIPGETKYAFDKRDSKYERSNLFNEEYRTIKLEDGTNYDIPFKLIPTGETDIVLAKVKIKDKALEDSIVFSSGTGTIFTSSPTRKKGEYLLSLPSGKDNDGIEVFATVRDKKRQTLILGKLIVISYSVKRPKVTLVPVNGTGIGVDPVVIKEELDKVYMPLAVDWQVNRDNSDFQSDANDLDITGSSMFSQYTEGMKNLNNSFVMHKAEKFDPSTIYLFLLKSSGDKNATGDMPRSKQFGYIFTETAEPGGKAALYRTIAHEIAHGAFHLNHVFDSQYKIAQGTTDNLLDYTAGTDLVKHQWDAIHDPGLVIGMFERDEEGESIIPDIFYVKEFIEKIRCSYISGSEANFSRKGLYIRSENFASNVSLSDGLTYGHIYINLNQEGKFKVTNLKIDESDDKSTFSFGNVFSIKVSGENRFEFKKYILPDNRVDYTSQLQKLCESIDSESDRSKKLELLKALSVCAYDQLNPETRIDLIKIICEESIGEQNEKLILKIIQTTPGNQAKTILDGLASIKVNDVSLIVLLIRKVNDAGIGIIGEDNYKNLIIAVTELVNRSSDLQSKINSLLENNNLENRLMNWQVSKEVLGAIKVSDVVLSDNGLLTVRRSEISKFTQNLVSTDGIYVSEPDWVELSGSTTLEPFDLVVFANNSNLDILNEATGSEKGEISIVPAVFLQYASQKQINNDVVKVATIASDIAGITLSGGTLALAKNITNLRKAWLLFEVINSGLNLSINLSEIANDPECKNVVDTYNKLIIILAIGELSYNGAKNLSSVIENVQNASIAATEKIKQTAQSFYDALREIEPSKLSASAKTGYRQLSEYAEKMKVKYGLTVNLKLNDEIIKYIKLNGTASSEKIIWKNLDETKIILANQNSNIISTAKTFANETGSSLYDAVLSNGYYVKFDLNDGRILLGNKDGNYYAFAIINDVDLGDLKTSIFNASDEAFNQRMTKFLITNVNKLKVYSGIVSKGITIAGKTFTLSSEKINTILGRFDPDIKSILTEFGSFKNVGLGEIKGGINILNKPDHYFLSNWWSAYNKPWLEKAINRGDDLYLATIPSRSEDLIVNGKSLGSYADEIKYLVIRNYKPTNITTNQWNTIKSWF